MGCRSKQELILKEEPCLPSFTVQADWACLLANTSEGKPHQNKSLIVVPMDSKGITKSAISKLGMHVGAAGKMSFMTL